jgi:hypothetical protein
VRQSIVDSLYGDTTKRVYKRWQNGDHADPVSRKHEL